MQIASVIDSQTPLEFQVADTGLLRYVTEDLPMKDINGLVEITVSTTLLESQNNVSHLLRLDRMQSETEYQVYVSDAISCSRVITPSSEYEYETEDEEWVEVESSSEFLLQRQSAESLITHSDYDVVKNIHSLSEHLYEYTGIIDVESTKSKIASIITEQIERHDSQAGVNMDSLILFLASKDSYLDIAVRASSLTGVSSPSSLVQRAAELEAEGTVEVSERELAPGDIRIQLSEAENR